MRPGWSWASHPRIWAGADGGWSGYPPSPPASPLPNTTAAGARPGGAGPCQAPGATLCHVVPRSALPSPAACLPPGTAQRPQGTPTPPVLHPASCCRAEELATGQTPPPSSPRCSPHFGGKPRLEDQGRIPPPFPGLRGEARCSPVPPVQPPPPLPRAAREPCPHGGQHPGTPRHCAQHPAQPASGVGAALRDVCLHAPSPRANLG